ncbi:PEP-CTERM sorting domain-containing protein [Candidatus Contendibacter odensensis]|uniref:Ice-binding protein C-terminal domain-containing protein n=1 Tax=Candidatus Contendobacter odensis Run_B_J11 TaxID=1400861 RepID=A0A7U7GCR5_9GAMM|nr:PEP-CTERM sorting domain-containing protein [Candidatus Contendobacter odensis]CDH46021.1 conserved exported hypothetical protein [Candidatus Contendobacter odensis Run_B_J11]
MMKSQTLRTLLAGALFALSPLASATLIASDDFNYTGALNNQNGGTGWGSSVWKTTGSGGATVVDPDLSGNRAAQFTANSDNAAYRKLGETFKGDNLYVGFFVQIAAGNLTSNDFLGLWLDNVTAGAHTTDRPNIGIKADGNGTNDVFVRANGTGGSFVPSSNLTNSTTYHIVGRLSRTVPGLDNSYTKFDVWLDPSVGQASAPDASSTSTTGNPGFKSISYVGFRTANFDAGDRVLVDQLRIADSWNSVMGIPEPAGLALMGLGLVALGLSRRRCM